MGGERDELISSGGGGGVEIPSTAQGHLRTKTKMEKNNNDYYYCNNNKKQGQTVLLCLTAYSLL